MKLGNVLNALYCEPWLIAPEMHSRLCDIVNAHIAGSAHAVNGIVAQFENSKGVNGAMRVIDNIAVIDVDGVISMRVGSMEKSSGVVDVSDIESNLIKARDDQGIEGILLDINSPGGSLTGVPELAQLIADISSVKPIAAHTDMLMASAAMWIAAGVDLIMASPSANVGSIGVYMAMLDQSRAFENAGLKTELFKRGKYKAAGLPGTSLSDEQRQLMQSGVDEVYDWFVSFVKEHRGNMDDEVFQGQSMRADKAVAYGLIDGVGNIEQALNELKELIEARRV